MSSVAKLPFELKMMVFQHILISTQPLGRTDEERNKKLSEQLWMLMLLKRSLT